MKNFKNNELLQSNSAGVVFLKRKNYQTEEGFVEVEKEFWDLSIEQQMQFRKDIIDGDYHQYEGDKDYRNRDFSTNSCSITDENRNSLFQWK